MVMHDGRGIFGFGIGGLGNFRGCGGLLGGYT